MTYAETKAIYIAAQKELEDANKVIDALTDTFGEDFTKEEEIVLQDELNRVGMMQKIKAVKSAEAILIEQGRRKLYYLPMTTGHREKVLTLFEHQAKSPLLKHKLIQILLKLH